QDNVLYDVEVVGMILAVQFLREEEAGRRRTVALGVDNRATIHAAAAFHSQPGQCPIDHSHRDLGRLLLDLDDRKHRIRWTPGHEGILGNEVADVEAKKAAAERVSSSRRALTTSFLTSKRDIRTCRNAKQH
ncbi:hypothetical protein BDR06DRAFT_881828, partial [Suillus hirtellus]